MNEKNIKFKGGRFVNKSSLVWLICLSVFWLGACAPQHLPSSSTNVSNKQKDVLIEYKTQVKNKKIIPTSNSVKKSVNKIEAVTQNSNKVIKEAKSGSLNCNKEHKICIVPANDTEAKSKPVNFNSVKQLSKIQKNKEQALLDNALDYCQLAQDLWQRGDLDKAIEALDQAYSLILKVNTDDDPQLIQQKDDIRFMISKRVLEIHASRCTAVLGNHNAIPLTMNKYVEQEIKRFQGPERRFFIEAYKRSGLYRPMIVKLLKQAGLPTELSWLPLIESGFKVRAMSHARALGLWQFIPSTGYKFGLTRNTWIDERMDPVKSTKAAIAYLNELHQIFGDWTTVLAAYNCGEGAVLRVIRSQRVSYLDNFWDLYDKLPQETAQYVPKFLAVLQILKHPKKYGFDLGDPDPPLQFDVVNIDKQVSLRSIAKALSVPFKTLCKLNPELRYQVTPPDSYQLRVPKGDGKILMAKLDNIPEWSPPMCQFVWHRVEPGETLSLLALRFHTTIRAIALANHLRRTDLIRVGQKLRIPLGRRRYPSLMYLAHLKKTSTYVVKKGDSLWLIAKRFGTTIRTLMAINHLNSPRLHVGQVLIIKPHPNRHIHIRVREAKHTYYVRPGDSLSAIARRKGIPLVKLLRANKIDKNTTIHPGEVLVLPE